MTDGPKISPEKIAKARTVLQGLPEIDRRKTRPQAAQILESDFRKALRKGYDPAELSRILKKEGIIIPVHLIEQFSPYGNVSAKSEKKQKPQEKQEIVSRIFRTFGSSSVGRSGYDLPARPLRATPAK